MNTLSVRTLAVALIAAGSFSPVISHATRTSPVTAIQAQEAGPTTTPIPICATCGHKGNPNQ